MSNWQEETIGDCRLICADCRDVLRSFIGIEIEPRYFDIACRRIEQAYRQGDLFRAPPPNPVQEGLGL